MKNFRPHITIILLILFLAFNGCGPSNEITQPGPLLVKNKVVVDDKKISPDDLSGYIQQKPNKKFLGLLRVNTWIYKQSNKGKSRKYKTWFREKIGKRPVTIDSLIADNTCRDMKLYLNNIGYFNSFVTRNIAIDKKKARVTYFVTAGKPYTIRNIESVIRDDTIAHYLSPNPENSLLRSGNNFNAYIFDEERSRITKRLRNEGYFDFSKDYIEFRLDSNLLNYRMDLQVIVNNPEIPYPSKPDSMIEINHRRYILNNIYINPDFNPRGWEYESSDTTAYVAEPEKDGDTLSGYYFITSGRSPIRPQVFLQSIYLKKGSLFRINDADATTKQLSSMPVNRLVNITFEKIPGPIDLNDAGSFGRLDGFVSISKSPVNSFSIETDVTNSAGNPGIAGNFIFQNKNLFHGAEVFRIKIRGAAESQGDRTTERQFLIFNTVETGVEVSVQIPRFLIPVKQERFPKYFRPKTSIITGWNYQGRPSYERPMINFSFGYNWDPSPRISHSLYPFEINSVAIHSSDSAFQKFIDESSDLRIKEQYTNHIIPAFRYGIIFSTQKLNRPVDFIYVYANIETAGNILRSIQSVLGAEQDKDGRYHLFGIPFAQYMKFETDFRNYHYISANKVLVTRALLGLGFPYGNSKAVPFEKAFYGGGANDIRGWHFKRLGPGSFGVDSAFNFDRVGDIKLEGNIEYRFPIYKWFKGAVFMDMGNIWLFRESVEFPGGNFRFSKFLDQIAVSSGFGLRLDFSFFIFRLDMATPVRDPANVNGKRWIMDNGDIFDILWNFGIGYPF